MPKPYFEDKKKKNQEIIRVNHAGEFGARRIYEGQLEYTQNQKDKDIISHMLKQELEHLSYFEEQIKSQNVRPTILMPFWNMSGYLLGAVSAKMNNKSAMLVTDAVEDVIESHYQEQIDYLTAYDAQNPMLPWIRQFQQEEIEHKHTAINHDSKKAPLANFMFGVVGKICKIAITLSKKI